MAVKVNVSLMKNNGSLWSGLWPAPAVGWVARISSRHKYYTLLQLLNICLSYGCMNKQQWFLLQDRLGLQGSGREAFWRDFRSRWWYGKEFGICRATHVLWAPVNRSALQSGCWAQVCSRYSR